MGFPLASVWLCFTLLQCSICCLNDAVHQRLGIMHSCSPLSGSFGDSSFAHIRIVARWFLYCLPVLSIYSESLSIRCSQSDGKSRFNSSNCPSEKMTFLYVPKVCAGRLVRLTLYGLDRTWIGHGLDMDRRVTLLTFAGFCCTLLTIAALCVV